MFVFIMQMKALAAALAMFGTVSFGLPIQYTVTQQPVTPTTIHYTIQQPTTTQQPVAQKPAATAQPVVQKPVTQPTTTTSSAGMTAAEQQMLNLINNARAQNGLAPLKADATLTRMAEVKSQDMINNNYFAHQSPTYGSPFQMMARFGVTYNTAGENIAGNSTVNGAFQAWMNSPGHRANILNGQYTKTGIGIVNGGPYGMMFTQEFVG
ncbi:MAG: CAP domain-containing protein [Mycobacterium leprae]